MVSVVAMRVAPVDSTKQQARRRRMYETQVSGILRSKSCANIYFAIPGTHIWPYHYSYIAQLIDQRIITASPTKPEEDPEYGGKYNPSTQTLNLMTTDAAGTGYFETANGRSTVVHECTHAIFHLVHSGKLIRAAENEFTAWLAATIYRMNESYDVWGSKDDERIECRRTLFQVAQRCIEHKSATFQVDSRAVSTAGEDLLRAEENRTKKRIPRSQMMPLFHQDPPKPPGPPLLPDSC
jgi:hypothetical protein